MKSGEREANIHAKAPRPLLILHHLPLAKSAGINNFVGIFCPSLMKVLLVNTAEHIGGAAIAAERLLHALHAEGVEAKMVVRDRTTDAPYILSIGGRWAGRLHFLWERLVIWMANRGSRRNLFKVSIANTGFDLTAHPAFREADIVHLHWVNQGMLSIRQLRKILHSGKRIVWTLHDMWPLTAICHYSYDCTAFRHGCGNCPFLAVPGRNDLSSRVFRRKLRAYGGLVPGLSVVAVSSWLARQVKDSILLGEKPIDVIANTLSLSQFALLDRSTCRRQLGIEHTRFVLLFGAARVDNPIKGFEFVRQAIEVLLSRGEFRREELHLLVVGEIKTPGLLDGFPIPTTATGLVSDAATMSQLYSSANVVLSTSFYETFGQMVVEAQACGVLPLAFDGSGQADLIDHKTNGYLAARLDVDNLADGLEWCLSEGQCIDRRTLREGVLQRYDERVIAQQYLEVYRRQLPRVQPSTP